MRCIRFGPLPQGNKRFSFLLFSFFFIFIRGGALMFFTSMDRQDEMTLELKYCERCGGLWLRNQSQVAVYCDRCRAQRAALLQSGRHYRPQNALQIECLRGVAEMGVRP
jgi:hypothetical protein